ncbi:hypothetical protein NECAME_17971, partial [Necator americanus]
RVHRARRLHHAAHGVFHVREAALARAGESGRLLGHRCHFAHGAHEVARRGENLARGRADLGRGGRRLARGGLLLPGRRGHFGHRGRDLQRRLLRLGHEARQFVAHAVEAVFQHAEFVAAVQREALRKVAGAHGVVHLHEPRHRHRDRAIQRVPGGERGNQHDAQRRGERDFRARDRVADGLRGQVGLLTVLVDEQVGGGEHLLPGRADLRERGLRGRARSGQLARYRFRYRQIARVGVAKALEALAVFSTEKRAFVLPRDLLHLRHGRGQAGQIARRAVRVGIDESRAFDEVVGLIGRRAQRGRVEQARHRVGREAHRLAVDGAQAIPGDGGHREHQHEQQAEAEDDACAEGVATPSLSRQAGLAGTGHGGAHCAKDSPGSPGPFGSLARRRAGMRTRRGQCVTHRQAREIARADGPALLLDEAQRGVDDHLAMARAQARMRRVAPERRAERVAIAHAVKAHRTDEQVQVDGIDVVAERATRHAAREQVLDRADRARVAAAEGLQALDVFRAVNVLDGDEAHEVAVAVVIVEGEFDKPAQAFRRVQFVDVQVQFERTDVAVDLVEHGFVQPFLAAEVVIQHALGGVGALSDRVYARACETHGREFGRRHFEDIAPGLLGIVLAPAFGLSIVAFGRSRRSCHVFLGPQQGWDAGDSSTRGGLRALQFDALDIAHDDDIRSRAGQRDHADEHERPDERARRAHDQPHDQRRDDARQIEDAAREPEHAGRRDIRDERPAERGHALREERHREDRDHGYVALDEVRENDVGEGAAGHHADRRGNERHDREEADLEPAHVALGGEVGGEPREEEHERGVARELPEADARELTAAHQLAGHAPVEALLFRLPGSGLPVGLALVTSETAPRLDVIELGAVGCGVLVRLAIQEPPHEAEHNAHAAHHVEERTPAVGAHQREEERAEEREADVLAHRVGARGERALALREPRGDHTAIGRKARRLRGAETEAAREQRAHPADEALCERAHRPERHRQPVGELAAEAVEEHAARNLRDDVAPREHREHEAHERRVDAQFPGELRRCDAEHGAVEVIDHRADGQQAEDAVARFRAAHGALDGRGCGKVRRVAAPRRYGWCHVFVSDMSRMSAL